MSETNSTSTPELDVMLHQPVRTQIVAYLVGRRDATFTELKRVLQISDGNLESHLKKLIVSQYIETRKETSNNRQQTIYTLTENGHAALRVYMHNLQRLLRFKPEQTTRSSATRRNTPKPA